MEGVAVLQSLPKEVTYSAAFALIFFMFYIMAKGSPKKGPSRRGVGAIKLKKGGK
ncbi:MAG: hypothetical protein M1150_04150 [Patescibacteria group bacterium]|nr:hypothetical protein [Patescibacteria group bacterium]